MESSTGSIADAACSEWRGESLRTAPAPLRRSVFTYVARQLMRILPYTSLFPPSIGGIETQACLLAHAFCKLGHEVKVYTNTPSADGPAYPFEVHRRPGRLSVVRMQAWA